MHMREAVITRLPPDLLAVDLAVFHPHQLVLHAEVHSPGVDGKGVAGARGHVLLPGPPQQQHGSILTNLTALPPVAPMFLECLARRRHIPWGPNTRQAGRGT